jgi:hypothetical protein
LEKGNVDLVTFTSASSVRAYVETVGQELSRRAPAASIGPATSEAIADAGVDLKVEATESTIDGFGDAIERRSRDRSDRSIGTRKVRACAPTGSDGRSRTRCNGVSCEIVTFKTIGDKKVNEPLSSIGAKGLFTHELEVALSKRKVHCCVHSLKDLPTESPDGLEIVAQLEREIRAMCSSSIV